MIEDKFRLLIGELCGSIIDVGGED